MKKKFIVLMAIAVMLSLLILVSCENKAQLADMRITLEKEVASRTIVPADVALDITSYRIEVTGPDSSTQTFNTRRSTFVLENVPVGKYNIKAYGLNDNSTALVQGSCEFDLNETNTSATVVLHELIGTGSLSLTYTWPSGRVKKPSLEVSVTAQDFDFSFVPSVTVNSSSASFSKTDLKAGSYVVSASLYEGSTKIAGISEAIRIVDKKTTTGTIEFNLDNAVDTVGSLTVNNKAGVPVVCTIKGIVAGSTIAAQETIDVYLDTSTLAEDELTIDWYLDGIKIGEGKELKLTPAPGQHRLDVIAKTKMLASTGSTTLEFEAGLLGEIGEPILAGDIATGGGRQRVIFTPDGRVLISSDATKKMSVYSIIRNTLVKEGETSYTAPIKDMLFINGDSSRLAVLHDSPIFCERMLYNSATGSFTKEVADNGEVDVALSFDKVFGLVNRGSWDNSEYFAITGHEPVCDDLVIAGRHISKTGTAFGEFKVKSALLIGSGSSSIFTSSYDGDEIMLGNKDTGFIDVRVLNNSYVLSYVEGHGDGTSFAPGIGMTSAVFVPSDNSSHSRLLLAVGDSFQLIDIDKTNKVMSAEGSAIARRENQGSSFNTVKMFTSHDNGGTTFIYCLNEGDKSISTYSISGSTLSFIARTELDFAPVNGELCRNGAYMIVHSAMDAEVTLFKIRME